MPDPGIAPLQEGLAVVGGHHHQGVVRATRVRQPVEQAAQLEVLIQELPIVIVRGRARGVEDTHQGARCRCVDPALVDESLEGAIELKAAAIRRQRLERKVRIVEVDP